MKPENNDFNKSGKKYIFVKPESNDFNKRGKKCTRCSFRFNTNVAFFMQINHEY